MCVGAPGRVVDAGSFWAGFFVSGPAGLGGFGQSGVGGCCECCGGTGRREGAELGVCCVALRRVAFG